ncbi:MAG: hypothetical protein ACHQET_13285 [Chitinophagales bacterium]
MKKLTRQICFSGLLVIVVALAFASKGGGGGDKKDSKLKSEFTPIRSISAFTLKSNPMYSGSYSISHDKESNKLSVNAFMTYQKGNSIYILPYKYTVSASSYSNASKTNLQFLGVKIKMPK